jgi:peptide-methionine (S)-S-oxide reductase
MQILSPVAMEYMVVDREHSCIDETCDHDEANQVPVTRSNPLTARVGDIVALEDLLFVPENGFVPEPLFDLSISSPSSTVSLVLHCGNYLPGLHELIDGCRAGDIVSNVSIDAGWGQRRLDLIFSVPISKLQQQLDGKSIHVGMSLRLKGGIDVIITDIIDDGTTIVLDANPPLAGTSYLCSFKVISIHRSNSCGSDTSSWQHDDTDRYQVATFALGCFWGAELAFMRTEGVVGTRVGYSQGTTSHPTYEDVCRGHTQHRESIQVIYDASIVSYETLAHVAISRLQSNLGSTSVYGLHDLFRERDKADSDDQDESKQYRYGFYYHSIKQRDIAKGILSLTDDGIRFDIEVREASTFWKAEEWHQQYLYKGGQSARKGALETIRCYG